MNAADGSPRVFPDRECCRAIQIAEYEQLPPEAMEDGMRPAPDELTEVCGCLHCGHGGATFEAVEMRWLANEQMWACPCTTCGGRGFNFDVHPIAPRWECFQCGKKWAPPNGNHKPSNCKCPVCGCTNASGWFDDEYSEEEIQAMSEEEYAKAFGKTRAQEEEDFRKFNEEFERKEKERKERAASGLSNEMEDPWNEPDPATMFDRVDGGPPGQSDQSEEPDDAAIPDLIAGYNPEDRQGEEDTGGPVGPMRDDIDFPRNPRNSRNPRNPRNPQPPGTPGPTQKPDEGINEDDIPS